MYPDERYETDPLFRAAVNLLEALLARGDPDKMLYDAVFMAVLNRHIHLIDRLETLHATYASDTHDHDG